MALSDFPGTEQHQRLLQAVVSHYAGDPRVLAVLVFGSLGRGTRDEYSDLDLDIVLADDVRLDVMGELQRLCDSFAVIDERAAVIVPQSADAGDVVLASLAQLSIRYHALARTSPNVVESLRLLSGSIGEETIRAAGMANARTTPDVLDGLDALCGRCLRALAEADVALRRRRLWFAVEQLSRARNGVIEAFGAAHGAVRPLHYFQDHADAALQARLAGTLPGDSLASAQRALLRLIDLVGQEVGTITGDRFALSAAQHEMLQRIKTRQTALVFE